MNKVPGMFQQKLSAARRLDHIQDKPRFTWSFRRTSDLWRRRRSQAVDGQLWHHRIGQEWLTNCEESSTGLAASPCN